MQNYLDRVIKNKFKTSALNLAFKLCSLFKTKLADLPE